MADNLPALQEALLYRAHDVSELRHLATRYVWWKSPDEVLRRPHQFIAQVMNIGDYRDVRELSVVLGDDFLREIIRTAEIGEFDSRAWHYWHYRLGLVEFGKVPPLPTRKLT